jgi:hypothetical protein
MKLAISQAKYFKSNEANAFPISFLGFGLV